MTRDNRIGKIEISESIEHLNDIIKSNLFSKLIILKIEKKSRYLTDTFESVSYEYTAYSELFDIVGIGCEAPFYHVVFTRHDNDTITFKLKGKR